jgi:hypothetical protein
MSTLLWILAFALAAVFVASGAMKIFVPREELLERTPYVEDFPHTIIQGIGLLEILGALGLVVPALTGTATSRGPRGAAGRENRLICRGLVHLRRGDGTRAMLPSLVLAVLSVVVAWARFGPYPL